MLLLIKSNSNDEKTKVIAMKLFDDFEAVRFPEENLILLLLGDTYTTFMIRNINTGASTGMLETIILQ